MKLIPLSQGKFAQVDDEDYDRLIKFKWCASKSGKGSVPNAFYALSLKKDSNNKDKRILMHRIIMNVNDKSIWVDHKNRDGLDNQKCNLRLSTPSQNNTNKIGFGKSKFRGVCLCKHQQKRPRKDGTICPNIHYKWAASIKFNGKSTLLGKFPHTEEGEIQAALLYNEHAKNIHKEFARLNIV